MGNKGTGELSQILVCGLINVETTLRIEGFPLAYEPVLYPFNGIHSSVSGVGYNVAKALTVLGDTVRLLAIVGEDDAGILVRRALEQNYIPAAGVLAQAAHTAQSVILYDPSGRRMIHTDLKDMQQQLYPVERFVANLEQCDLAILCNINYSRPFLALAQQANVPIATDVHAIHDLEDPYNGDYMAAARILFMSHERLPVSAREWAERVMRRYGPEVLVIALGADGALLAVKSSGLLEHLPAVVTRPIVSTIGAGDALFSSFCHFYVQNGDPYAALQRAILFASYKIGEPGAAAGFLTETALNLLFKKIPS